MDVDLIFYEKKDAIHLNCILFCNLAYNILSVGPVGTTGFEPVTPCL